MTNEVDELKAHIARLREALTISHQNRLIKEGMKVEQARIHAEVIVPIIDPARSLTILKRDVIMNMLTDMEDLHYDPAMLIIQDIIDYANNLGKDDE